METKFTRLGSFRPSSWTIQSLIQNGLQLATFLVLCFLLLLASLYVHDQQQRRQTQDAVVVKEVRLAGVCTGVRSMVRRQVPDWKQVQWFLPREQLACAAQKNNSDLFIFLPPDFGPRQAGSCVVVTKPPTNLPMTWSGNLLTIRWPVGAFGQIIWPGTVIELQAPIEITEDYGSAPAPAAIVALP